MNELEKYWVAGLLEGEGCFGVYNIKRESGTTRQVYKIQILMTDEDVIRKLHSIIGGTICVQGKHTMRSEKHTMLAIVYTKEK